MSEISNPDDGQPLAPPSGLSDDRDQSLDSGKSSVDLNIIRREIRPNRVETDAFDVLIDRLPSSIGVTREVVRDVVADLIRVFPSEWTTPRVVRLSDVPYPGRAAEVQRLVRTDLAAVSEDSERWELLTRRVLPSVRRLEREGASREELTDVLLVVLEPLPDDDQKLDLARSIAAYLLAEDDPRRRTVNYYISVANLSNAVSSGGTAAETLAAALLERVLYGMKSIQESQLDPFDAGSVEAKQVRIASHNSAASILRIAQSRSDRRAIASSEVRRLELLSAAFDKLQVLPLEPDEIVHRIGLAPFLLNDSAHGSEQHQDDYRVFESRCEQGLLAAHAVGAIGSAYDDETLHDAYASAISATVALTFMSEPGRAATRFFNSAVSISRLSLAGIAEPPDRPRAALLCLAIGCAFLGGSVTDAIVQNDALMIGASLAGQVAASQLRASSTSALVVALADFAESSGLTSPDAGQYRGDAVRIAEVAERLRGSPGVVPEDLPGYVVALAFEGCGELLGHEGPPLGAEEPIFGWVASSVGRIFSGALDPRRVKGGLWDIRSWIVELERSRERLLEYGTAAWRGSDWQTPIVAAGQVDSGDWERLQNVLEEPPPSIATALERYFRNW